MTSSRYQVAEHFTYGVVLENGDVENHTHPDIIELDPEADGVIENIEVGNLVLVEDES